MADTVPVLFTVGHSQHSWEYFIGLLEHQDIDVLVDVRSAPYSKYVPHFNKEPLSGAVKAAGRQYVYMGHALGGRWNDPRVCFDDGTVDYALVSRTDEFRAGVATLLKNIRKGMRAALMCCEKDPYDCHRFALDARFIQTEGVAVRHILEDGSVIDNACLEQRLLDDYPPPEDLFAARPAAAEALRTAYERRNRDIAYVLPSPGAEA